jgi:hypothetical protein
VDDQSKQNECKCGINHDLAAAILGANCSTGMAVAAQQIAAGAGAIAGLGLAPAIAIVAVGAAVGIGLKNLLGAWSDCGSE